MERAVVSSGGTHLVETLPTGQLKNVQWISRSTDASFREFEPSKLLIAKPGIDVVTCPEFCAQLVKNEDEILVTVYADRLSEVEDLLPAKSCTAAYLKRGFKVRSVWEVIGNEF